MRLDQEREVSQAMVKSMPRIGGFYGGNDVGKGGPPGEACKVASIVPTIRGRSAYDS